MAKIKGAVILARALKSIGVEVVFSLPGGPMPGVVDECQKLGTKLIFVRHEQAAAMMAHAYSRVAGKTGVCITASGPATVNAATGVSVAFDDSAPLIAIGGSAAMHSRAMGSFEEMDQVALMRPITKSAWQIQSAERITDFVDMAFRHATTNKPGPVYLDLPHDILMYELDEQKVKLPVPPAHTGRPSGDEKLVEEAIRILEKAERPIVIAGSGALWSEAGSQLEEFVDSTQIPFFTLPLARGLIAEDHPLCFPGARSFAWKSADVLLLVGTRVNFMIQHLRSHRFSPDLKLIAVNIDAEEIGHNKRADVGIAGDAKAVLKQLTEQSRSRFPPKSIPQSAWKEELRKVNAERDSRTSALLNSDDSPIHPLRLCKEIRDILPRDAILAVDGHEIMNFARQSIPTYFPRHRLNPGPSGCMGVGVPFGIGAKVANPEKQVMVLTGDGAFGLNGMEIDTAVRNDLPLVLIVSNNGGWAGVPGAFTVGRELGFTRYDKMAEALGAWGCHVEKPGDIRPALEGAFASGKPALINVVTSSAKATTQRFGSMGPDVPFM
jgi:acetolactate synthase-1/2/3 large subunit